MDLYKKLHFSKFCFHFYVFNKDIMDNTVFFTNFNQLVNGLNVEVVENHVKFNYDSLYYYSVLDLFMNDDYMLYSIFETVY